MRLPILVIAALLLSCGLAWAVGDGPVLEYNFAEGSGDILNDSSGNGNHGAIQGAQWVRTPGGHALKFDGADDFVDCGNSPLLDITDTITVEVWARTDSGSGGEPGIVGKSYDAYMITYYSDGAWWYTSGGTNNCSASGALFGPGVWRHIVGTFDGSQLKVYIDGQLKNTQDTKFKTINSGKNLYLGVRFADPGNTDSAYREGAFFNGMIAGVRIYHRALSQAEIQQNYKREAGKMGKDVSGLDRVKLTPYYYFDKGRIHVIADLSGFMPFPGNAALRVALATAGGLSPISSREISEFPEHKRVNTEFDISGLETGDYEIRATLVSPEVHEAVEKMTFRYPPDKIKVPSPATEALPSLLRPAGPAPFSVHLAPGGGFDIEMNGEKRPVESLFSYPHGGFNKLSSTGSAEGDQEWKVSAMQTGQDTYSVTAEGKFYTIDRAIKVFPNRVSVRDTIANKSDAELGVIVRNQAAAVGLPDTYIGGRPSGGVRSTAQNPTVFAGKEGLGLGLIALDDVYWVQCKGEIGDGVAAIVTETFALDRGARYTMEWAVYPNGTGDYYDFINAVRRDEGRNSTLEGGLGFITKSPKDRRMVVSRDWADLHNIKYGAIHCLSYTADDPEVSIEGIEFIDFPKEKEMLTEQMAAIKKENPDMKVTFHIAHSLYVTDNPDKYPDSKVVFEDGSQAVWGDQSFNYISKRRQDENWQWWIYYPTLENSFGKAMLDSVDVMMDEMGADGGFMDGFTRGYVSEWTYDRWDGHSAEIDPETKLITKKKGSVLLLSHPALAAYVRKVKEKGGVIIANNSLAITRTIAREGVITNREVHEGPEAHLEPTPMCLSNPRVVEGIEDNIIVDIRNKLRWANLYSYYETGDITRESVPKQMYPITFEELHSGYVKGTERLVTMNSGLYGWHGDHSMHFVYLYDGLGVRIPNRFFSTIDSSGVRTRLDLNDETVVVKKIPVTLETSQPVNAICGQYDEKGIRISLNGKGRVEVLVSDGDFRVRPNTDYTVTAGKTMQVKSDGRGRLSFPISLNGEMEISMK